MNGYGGDPDSGRSVLQSVLDKLLVQPASGSIGESDRHALRDALQRDLEMLLNTRRRKVVIPEEFINCAGSILNFGVPDLMHCGDLNTPKERDIVCESLAKAIEAFEPRLTDVSVKLVPSQDRKFNHHFQLEFTVVSLAQREILEMSLRRNTGAMSLRAGDD